MPGYDRLRVRPAQSDGDTDPARLLGCFATTLPTMFYGLGSGRRIQARQPNCRNSGQPRRCRAQSVARLSCRGIVKRRRREYLGRLPVETPRPCGPASSPNRSEMLGDRTPISRRGELPQGEDRDLECGLRAVHGGDRRARLDRPQRSLACFRDDLRHRDDFAPVARRLAGLAA